MTYRPYIDTKTHERVELFMVGRDGSPNHVYEEAVELLINEDGEYDDWASRIKNYAENTNKDESDILNMIITEIIDESGDPKVKHKEKIGL